jgi:protein Mpv17
MAAAKGWLLRGLASYNAALSRQPLLAKAATGGTLGAAGDLVAQSATQDSCDLRRTAGFAAFGLCYVGGFNHYWFGWLSRQFPGTGTRPALAKLAVQQLVANPLFYLPSFYCINGVANGHGADQIVAKATDEYTSTLIKTWQTWLPSSAFQFLVVPERYQVLWVSGVAFGWNVYLSLLYHSSSATASASATETKPTPRA